MDHGVIHHYTQAQALVAKITAYAAELEGMKAANALCAIKYHEPTYTQDDFKLIADLITQIGVVLQQL